MKLTEKEFYDYGTGTVVGDNIFANKTYTPFYDGMMKDPEYYAKKHNLKGEIKMLSPKQYYEICANDIFNNVSVQQLLDSRRYDKSINDDLIELITEHKRRLFLPYINLAERQQEGLHRMYVAGEMFGWNHKFPVLVITFADEARAKQEKEDKLYNEKRNLIRRCVNSVIQYKYSNFSDFEKTLQWRITQEFTDYYGERKDDYPLTMSLQDDQVTVTVDNCSYEFYLEDIKFELDDKELVADDDIEMDLDTFLQKYGI